MPEKKRILIVDAFGYGAAQVARSVYEKFFSAYQSSLELIFCKSAEEAIDWISENGKPDAMVVQNRIMYGVGVDPLSKSTDPELKEAGIRLIQFIRTTMAFKNLWIVGLASCRQDLQPLKDVVGECGNVLTVPYDPKQLVTFLCHQLGIDTSSAVNSSTTRQTAQT
jgi:hypothetical protein